MKIGAKKARRRIKIDKKDSNEKSKEGRKKKTCKEKT